MRGSLAVGMNGSVFSEPVKECRRAEWLGGDRFHWGPLSLRYLAEEGGPRGHGLCGGWKSSFWATEKQRMNKTLKIKQNVSDYEHSSLI